MTFTMSLKVLLRNAKQARFLKGHGWSSQQSPPSPAVIPPPLRVCFGLGPVPFSRSEPGLPGSSSGTKRRLRAGGARGQDVVTRRPPAFPSLPFPARSSVGHRQPPAFPAPSSWHRLSGQTCRRLLCAGPRLPGRRPHSLRLRQRPCQAQEEPAAFRVQGTRGCHAFSSARRGRHVRAAVRPPLGTPPAHPEASSLRLRPPPPRPPLLARHRELARLLPRVRRAEGKPGGREALDPSLRPMSGKGAQACPCSDAACPCWTASGLA